MQIETGARLAHYEIVAPLGKGGMGEVYRAKDSKLGREVAIKVLPDEFTRDSERLARFEREARVLASLDHPHIAAIHGFEQVEDVRFLVMQIADGEDLSDRIARQGAIPVEEALEIAKQIAAALEVAHEQGIVHRDLKPANIKIDEDGKVRILDFGLAKAFETEESDEDFTNSPTMVRAATHAGVILGTAAYMSPEQARGKKVDKRADIWSFGVVLWEMLTGKRLFGGETVSDTLASVLKEEPDWSLLPEGVPYPVRHVLERCLKRDPRERLRDIGDARLELDETRDDAVVGMGDSDPKTAEALRSERRRRAIERRLWLAVTLVAVILAAALAYMQLTTVDEPEPAVRFWLDVPDGWSLARNDFDGPVPSPDGRWVVFFAMPQQQEQAREPMLWIRPMDVPKARPLAGTEGGFLPFWSPDGRFLAFFTEGELRRISLTDGTVQRICRVPRPEVGGGTWNAEGDILFSAGGTLGQIYLVAANGGEAKSLMTPDSAHGEFSHHSPEFLPDGRRFLFDVGAGDEENSGRYVASLDAPTEKQRVAPAGRVLWASGNLLYVENGVLYAQPFDAETAEIKGDPLVIASSISAWRFNPRIGRFGVSTEGTLAFFSGGESSNEFQLAWVDREGTPMETVGAPGSYGQLALSPDGRNVALEVLGDGGEYDLWVMELARGVTSRVTSRAGDDRDPLWSPDGRSLAFAALGADKGVLRQKGLRLADPETLLTETSEENHPEFWSGDAETLLFVKRTLADEQSVWALDLPTGETEEVLSDRFRVDEPQLSPDGRWLAYVSPESGRDEVYVEPFRREGDRARVSLAGGGQPKWRGDGNELFFVSFDRMLMSVEVNGDGDRLEVGLPVELFEVKGVQGTGYDDYAPAADGKRFLVKKPMQEDRPTRLQIIRNWTSLLN
ncbi:MAG: protein kinase [Thermoanaerobaculia bacterium]|nr:protein kinase [Thermoanaerobaculia bacterium]